MGNQEKAERNGFMRYNFLKSAIVAFCLAIPLAWGGEDDDVRALPLSMVTQLDGGQVVKGTWNGSNIDDAFIQRTSVWITQEITIGSRLDVRAGVGGLFWYATPRPDPGISEVGRFAQLPKFGPGITRADMVYRLGNVKSPMFTLQAGFFPYKYNPDAKNLGEYLLRSGAYPGYLTTGGWNIVSEAGYMMQGIRLNMSLWGGRFQSEFLLPMERDLPPNGDLSPAYIGTVRPFPGIEVGGGVSCHHCIAVKPSVTSPKVKYGGDATTIGNGSGYIIENPAYTDSLPITDLTGSNPRYIYDSAQFYTFQGVKLMARASFDPKAYVSMPMLGPQDLKIFGEVALLGVKNYPFYYEKKSERMPVMFGINLPVTPLTYAGFRLLDLLSFQMEYYNSPFANSLENAYQYQNPTYPFVDSNSVSVSDPNLHDKSADAVAKDNWKWSLYGKKQVVKGLNLYAQVANDHLRLPFWTALNSWSPITTRQGKDWYYLVRFELGI